MAPDVISGLKQLKLVTTQNAASTHRQAMIASGSPKLSRRSKSNGGFESEIVGAASWGAPGYVHGPRIPMFPFRPTRREKAGRHGGLLRVDTPACAGRESTEARAVHVEESATHCMQRESY